MPNIHGIATIRELIKLKPKLPFIAMCGFTDRRQGAPDFLGMAIKLGAVAALQNPFRAGDLFEAIARALGFSFGPSSGLCQPPARTPPESTTSDTLRHAS